MMKKLICVFLVILLLSGCSHMHTSQLHYLDATQYGVLPESTLVMLVSAFASKEHIMAAYEEAVKERYRFFSFGDAMFIG